MRRKYVSAAFFDLDGTLLDSKNDIVDSTNYMLKALGAEEKTAGEIESCIGFGKDKLISGVLADSASPELIKRADDIFSEYYREHMFDTTRLFPGVPEILEHFRDKTLMMITNKDREVSLRTLARFNIDKYFDSVIGGDDANCRKPDACPINRLISEKDISKNEAIMIGDSAVDIISGKAAGILTCGLTCGIGRKKNVEKAGPDYILDDIRKLKEVIC